MIILPCHHTCGIMVTSYLIVYLLLVGCLLHHIGDLPPQMVIIEMIAAILQITEITAVILQLVITHTTQGEVIAHLDAVPLHVDHIPQNPIIVGIVDQGEIKVLSGILHSK